jgi:hypothetical protein
MIALVSIVAIIASDWRTANRWERDHALRPVGAREHDGPGT